MLKPAKKHTVAIIGAGPAGISCAIQLKRYKIDYIIFEKDSPGGLLLNANLVENYPGFPEGIPGNKLVSLFCKQLKYHRIKPVRENVVFVDYKNGFRIKTDKGTYQSDILVIASGTKPKTLSIDVSKDIKPKIHYDIITLKKTKEKRIGIIGAGDAAFDYALNISRKNKVMILNRSKVHRCLPSLFERCMKNKNIKYIVDFVLSKIEFKNKNLILYSRNKKTISVDLLLIAIGRKPNIDFLKDMDKRQIQRLENIKKLYMIGDVKNMIFRQTAIAMGDGIKAAMEIALKEQGAMEYENNRQGR